jgi:hypothetical protein
MTEKSRVETMGQLVHYRQGQKTNCQAYVRDSITLLILLMKGSESHWQRACYERSEIELVCLSFWSYCCYLLLTFAVLLTH